LGYADVPTSDMGAMAKRTLALFPYDHYTTARAGTLQALFIGHLESRIGDLIPDVELAASHSSDRILSLLNLGVQAHLRASASYDFAELEAWIEEKPLDLSNWQLDVRGGVFLMAVRQYAKALQGKTRIDDASSIFTDSEHDSMV
jgi:hypothetical protein